jgi:hypothetical protein
MEGHISGSNSSLSATTEARASRSSRIKDTAQITSRTFAFKVGVIGRRADTNRFGSPCEEVAHVKR